MNTTKKNPRAYTCKDEELPTIGGYVLTSMRRDQTIFEAYSPKYKNEGLTAFEGEIKAAEELVNPKSETNQLKLITSRLYGKMDLVWTNANYLVGYVGSRDCKVPISVTDFGLTALKQRARAKDAEGTIKNLRFVSANIAKYKTELAEQGLTDEMEQFFIETTAAISADNVLQYDIVNNRKAIVQANLDLMNGLYYRIKEVCKHGKILFAGNVGKLKEYTYSELLKKVRNVSKPGNKDNKGGENGDKQPE